MSRPAGEKGGLPREPGLEQRYRVKVREYCAILAEAWGVPVRGFIWYVETGESVEVT